MQPTVNANKRPFLVSLQGSSTSSSSSNMSDEALELPIHIGGCQKWVTGLGRRTTCDDIIYALIRHEANPDEYVDVTNFAIFESWRGVERPLKGRTKILKVWKAWGAERHHVQFFVRKFSNPLDGSIDVPVKSRRSRKSHSHCSKHRDRGHQSHNNHNHQPQSKSNPTTRDSSRVRGRREVRGQVENTKDPTVVHQEPQTDNDKVKAKEFQDLVQLIIHQEKRIQEQLSRVHEMDVQIENYEAKVHFMRVAENGQNYVQEAYLQDKGEESSSSNDDIFPAVKKEDMDAYMHICDGILRMETKISEEQSKIADLSVRIQEESVLEPPPPITTLDHDDSGDSGNSSNPEERLIAEVERMRRELERCVSLSEAQHHQLSLVNATLTECETQLCKKQDVLESLCVELNQSKTMDLAVESSAQQTDKGGTRKWASSSDVTSAASSRSDRLRSSVKSSLTESGGLQTERKEQWGSCNLPPRTLSRTGDEAVDKAFVDYFVTKSSHPPSSCTTQYMYVHQQNKHSHFDDSNSDTGLSSLHSDDAPAILETLVWEEPQIPHFAL